MAVAWSVQRYLLFAILSCIPDRQRTLRELEVGRTLFKEKGRWAGGQRGAGRAGGLLPVTFRRLLTDSWAGGLLLKPFSGRQAAPSW